MRQPDAEPKEAVPLGSNLCLDLYLCSRARYRWSYRLRTHSSDAAGLCAEFGGPL